MVSRSVGGFAGGFAVWGDCGDCGCCGDEDTAGGFVGDLGEAFEADFEGGLAGFDAGDDTWDGD